MASCDARTGGSDPGGAVLTVPVRLELSARRGWVGPGRAPAGHAVC
jgi:hypothetical protein